MIFQVGKWPQIAKNLMEDLECKQSLVRRHREFAVESGFMASIVRCSGDVVWWVVASAMVWSWFGEGIER